METEAQSAPETVTAGDDVHADVRAAVEALTGKQEAQTTEVAQEAPKERARDDPGQFTKADSVQQPEVAKTVPDTDPIEGKTQAPSPVHEAPSSWSAPAKAKWSTLDPSIQAEIVRREQNMHEGGQKWSEEKRRYEETFAPVREAARKSGIDEHEGMRRLIAANEFLDRDPVGAIQWLAQAYGVDLQNMSAQPARPQADPMLTQLSQEVSFLKSDLEQRTMRDIQSQIDAFKNAPGHEHFDDVKETMGKLLQNGLAEDMEDAYQKAVWQTASVREKLIAAQTAPAVQIDRARQQVDKAKKAAISLSGSPASGAAPAPKQDYETVEEAARAAARQHGWGV
jgi:hypothetical protein